MPDVRRVHRMAFIRQACIILLAAFSGPLGYMATLIAFVSPIDLGGQRIAFAIQLIGTAVTVSLTLSFAILGIGAPAIYLLLSKKRGRAASMREFWRTLTYTDRAWVLTLPVCWLGFALAKPAREVHARFLSRAVVRGEALVAAIERYRAVHQKFPSALGDLVPEYIAQIPSTGMLAYPEFNYASPAVASEQVPYEVFVWMPLGLNGDMLVYWPGGKYPEQLYGGGVREIARWAYILE